MKRLFFAVIVVLLPLMILVLSCGGSSEDSEQGSQMQDEGMQGSAAKAPTLAGLDWMLGTWKSSGGKTTSYEQWMKSADALFTGMSFRLDGNDTLITELLTLAATDSGTFYIADVAHNPEPTSFKMSTASTDMAVFENPEHDFPTRISYKMLTPDSVVAIVEGDQNGEMTGFEIHYERVTK